MQRTNLKTTIPNCCLSKFEAETKFEDNQSTNHVIKTQYVQAGKNVTQFVFVSPLSVGLFCSFQLVSTEGNGSVKFDQCSNTLLLIPPLTIRHSSQSRSASSPAVLQLDILVNALTWEFLNSCRSPHCSNNHINRKERTTLITL